MRKTACLALLICLATVATGLAVYNPAGPPDAPVINDRGLAVHLDSDGSVSTYGLITSDAWSYATPGIGIAGRDDRNTYKTTDEFGSQTAMRTDQDWIVQVRMRQNAAADGNRILEIGGLGGDILQIVQDQTNHWYMVGDPDFGGSVGFDSPGADIPTSDWFTLTIHYLVNHPHPERDNGGLDVWVDDNLAYDGGMEAKNNVSDYRLDSIDMKGYADYDDIMIGDGPNSTPLPEFYDYSDRYNNWQANHPFTLGALHNSASEDQYAARTQRFKSVGLNTLIWWKPDNARNMFKAAVRQGLQWACGSVGGTGTIADAIANVPGDPAFILAGDEPAAPEELPPLAAIIDWVHTNHPTIPAFTNLSIGKIDHDLYITTCNPDIFSFDIYPLYRNGTDYSNYLYSVNWARQSARNYNLPNWIFLQAFGRDNQSGPTYEYRIPDEADTRYLVYSFLAHGGQGIMLFSYYGHPEGMVWDPCMPESPMSDDHKYEETITSRAWHAYRDVMPEVKNLAPTLINLRSKDAIGYVGTIPSGCSAYSTHGDLTSFTVVGAPSDPAMVGWFVDENEEEYFMIVNLVHGANLSKMDAARTVRLTFDSSVTQIERRNRLTGLIETINTKVDGSNRILDVWLPGGTGDLFKWSNGQPWK